MTVSAKFGTTKANTRTYVYDPDGRLLGEYGASAAAPLAETIWMQPEVANDNMFGGNDGTAGYAPLALVGGSGAAATLYWVHGSHLGVPLVITNTSAVTAAPTGYTAVGFPGQTRTLPDLYYNRYRDYDTTTGRYIQADPIGLEGGSNPFLYAEGNPLRYTDPLGLKSAYQGVGEIIAIDARHKDPSDRFPHKWAGYGVLSLAALVYDACTTGKCPPCKPYAVGRIGYQGPKTNVGGRDAGVPHYILFQVQQIPSTCECRWRDKTKKIMGHHHSPTPQGINLNSSKKRPPNYPR